MPTSQHSSARSSVKQRDIVNDMGRSIASLVCKASPARMHTRLQSNMVWLGSDERQHTNFSGEKKPRLNESIEHSPLCAGYAARTKRQRRKLCLCAFRQEFSVGLFSLAMFLTLVRPEEPPLAAASIHVCGSLNYILISSI